MLRQVSVFQGSSREINKVLETSIERTPLKKDIPLISNDRNKKNAESKLSIFIT